MTLRVALVVNKDDGILGNSETFIKSHIENLPYVVFSIIGNPGYRKLEKSNGATSYLSSRRLLPLSFRWAIRKMFNVQVASQDARALSRFFVKERIDVVLAEYGITGASVYDACDRAKVPLVIHFHGFDAYGLSLLQDYADVYKKMFSSAAALVAVSKHMCDQLVSLGAPVDKIFHNACGPHNPPGIQVKPDENYINFLMVGRLVDKKAPFISILAFAQVVEKIPTASLTVIGGGPLLSPCRQLVRVLDIVENVTFLGAQDHETVFQNMTRARCFIQHSVTSPDGDMEGTPVGVLEAMGLGLPVVSTRHGGISDVIEHLSTGFLVDEYDLAGMAQLMVNVAEDPVLASKIGTAAAESVTKNFSGEISIEKLSLIIRKSSSQKS